MRTRRKSRTSARAVVLAVTLALGGVGKAEPEAVRIDYAAPSGCPDAAAFARSLQERTTRFRRAAPDEQARRFIVRVTATSSSFSGRLEIRSPDGGAAVRSVEASICDDVASALALMTALAIDPNALTNPKTASESAAQATPRPASEPGKEHSAASETVVAARAPSVAHNASQPWRWSAGLMADMTFAVSPTLAYGGDLFVEAEAPTSSKLGPAVRMGIFLDQCNVDLPTGAAARFQWAVAAVEGCPVRLGVMDLRLAVHPCLAFRLGVLHGEGRTISQPKQTLSLWSDVGPVLRLRLAMTPRLILEAQGSLVLPLRRPTFTILDTGRETTVYSVPSIGGSAGIGVAYQFR